MQTVSFATARRGFDAESLNVAKRMLHKGYGYQNAARIAGLNEMDLRAYVGAPTPRASKPVPWTPARLPRAVAKPRVAPDFAPTCADDTTAILDRIGAKYGLTRRDLLGANRTRFYAFARQEAMATVRAERPHLSYPTIGRIFGGRDHTTIMHGETRHLERVAWGEVLIAFASLTDTQPDLFARAA